MTTKKISPFLLATLSSAFILSACAGPESYQQKMARYTPKVSGQNPVPEIKTLDFKFSKTNAQKTSRGPASIEKPKANENEVDGNPTNKKLYFLTLFSQYETLKNYSSEFVGPKVSICPNFHTSLLRHNEKAQGQNESHYQSKKYTYDSTKFSDDSYVYGKPELLLPLSKDETTPRVIDVLRGEKTPMNDFAINELVHKALDIHLAKTYTEIRELCEYGVSDNYYIYENLITHIKNNKFEADTKNMNTLLKTTLFSNMALVTSIEKQNKTRSTGRSVASVESSTEEKNGNYGSEVMTRLNVTWANQYFNSIKESR